jgi:hypothetical protein
LTIVNGLVEFRIGHGGTSSHYMTTFYVKNEYGEIVWEKENEIPTDLVTYLETFPIPYNSFSIKPFAHCSKHLKF